MIYKTQAYSALFGFPIDLDTDAKLVDAIKTKSMIDCGEYNKRGGGTIIAKLLSNADDSFTFEGLTGTHTISAVADITTIPDYWRLFTQRQQERHEADKVRWNSPKEA
jgi:hypothetical protein